VQSVGIEQEEGVLGIEADEVLADMTDVLLAREERLVPEPSHNRVNHGALLVAFGRTPWLDDSWCATALGVRDRSLRRCLLGDSMHQRLDMARNFVVRRDVTAKTLILEGLR
jgi:hypothetical protein